MQQQKQISTFNLNEENVFFFFFFAILAHSECGTSKTDDDSRATDAGCTRK